MDFMGYTHSFSSYSGLELLSVCPHMAGKESVDRSVGWAVGRNHCLAVSWAGFRGLITYCSGDYIILHHCFSFANLPAS